jgi:hypothetical protein
MMPLIPLPPILLIPIRLLTMEFQVEKSCP